MKPFGQQEGVLNKGMDTTEIALTDSLPLTCTRAGTCCHGKTVWLNPWELARLAAAKDLTSREFRDRYCEFGGIKLRFDTPAGIEGPLRCSQYLSDFGCSVHEDRPLVCRLYPLGRERRGKEVQYIHQGRVFPCLGACPNVVNLTHLTVNDYLNDQDVTAHFAASDAYLELMQQLADGAFALLIESGLAASGDGQTLRLWRKLGNQSPLQLTKYLGSVWIDLLMLPDLGDELDDPQTFSKQHHDILQSQAQSLFGNLGDAAAVNKASGLMMGLSLHLGNGLGANPSELAAHWIMTAKKLGAQE